MLNAAPHHWPSAAMAALKTSERNDQQEADAEDHPERQQSLAHAATSLGPWGGTPDAIQCILQRPRNRRSADQQCDTDHGRDQTT